MYGITYYSLKYHHYTTYVENVLSLHRFRRYVYPIYIKSDDDQPVETIEESSKDKQTQYFYFKTVFLYLFIPTNCNLLSNSGFKF